MDMDDDPWSNWGKALAIVPKRPLPEEADPNSSSQVTTTCWLQEQCY